MRWFLAPLIIVFGVLITVKADAIFESFGANAWAEAHLGSSGGSRLLYKLIGLGVIFIGFLYLTGLLQGFLGFIFSPLLRFSQPI